MAKDKITDYDTAAASNTDIGGIDIGEGCAPSGINNAIRELMAQIAAMNAGTAPLDDTFSVADPSDETKKVRIDAGGVTTGTTRVLTMPDKDVDLGNDFQARLGFTPINKAGDTGIGNLRLDGDLTVGGNFSTTGTLKHNGHEVWDAGNFDPGDKLDVTAKAADSAKLNGQSASYYTDIASRLGYTPAKTDGSNATGTWGISITGSALWNGCGMSISVGDGDTPDYVIGRNIADGLNFHAFAPSGMTVGNATYANQFSDVSYGSVKCAYIDKVIPVAKGDHVTAGRFLILGSGTIGATAYNYSDNASTNTLTIKKNGTSVGTFTANSSTPAGHSANVSVSPGDIIEFEGYQTISANDTGYVTDIYISANRAVAIAIPMPI